VGAEGTGSAREDADGRDLRSGARGQAQAGHRTWGEEGAPTEGSHFMVCASFASQF
jgi:hypothetical protein